MGGKSRSAPCPGAPLLWTERGLTFPEALASLKMGFSADTDPDLEIWGRRGPRHSPRYSLNAAVRDGGSHQPPGEHSPWAQCCLGTWLPAAPGPAPGPPDLGFSLLAPWLCCAHARPQTACVVSLGVPLLWEWGPSSEMTSGVVFPLTGLEAASSRDLAASVSLPRLTHC